MATKQDIKKITDNTESVKIHYNKELEKLKSYLQITVGNHSLIQEKRNNALINFFEDCMILLNEKMTVNFGDTPCDNGQTLMKYKTSTEHVFTKIYSDYYKLFLYFEEGGPVLMSSSDLIKSTTEIRNIFRKNFSNLKVALINEMEGYNSETSKNIRAKNAKQTAIESKKYYDKMNPATKSLSKNLTTYIGVLNNYFKKLGYEESVNEITP